MESTEHLFRREAGRMVCALTRLFGLHNFSLAEDVVQDAFCKALESWSKGGIPDSPSAWLMATAKHRALDVLRRERTARKFAPELGRLLDSEWTLAPVVEEMFAPSAIKDDLLRMMFSCCQPQLTEHAQVALILNVLCGFRAIEVAGAFVSSLAATEKRIQRAKQVLAASKTLFDIAVAEDFVDRLPAVHRALYLLFNEGYHGASGEHAIRADLCREAMRLLAILLDHPRGATPTTYALSSLMCLNTARLPGRLDGAGNLLSLVDQDRTLWDQQLIREGLQLLDLSASGDYVSEYHVEAAIAATHASAANAKTTDWTRIAALYDELIALRPTPVVALNRAIAVAQAEGPERGLEELQAIGGKERLSDYPFYWAALGELELSRGRIAAAGEHLEAARIRARNPVERRFYAQRLGVLHSKAD
jgi:RNA polymerase sigma-70 factor (ECF subfamily)